MSDRRSDFVQTSSTFEPKLTRFLGFIFMLLFRMVQHNAITSQLGQEKQIVSLRHADLQRIFQGSVLGFCKPRPNRSQNYHQANEVQMQAFSKTEMVLISQIVLLINFNMLWATWRKIIHLSLTAENRARTKRETLANWIYREVPYNSYPFWFEFS